MSIKLTDLIEFADHGTKTYGLGYSLTLKRNKDNDPIIRFNAVDAAKIDVKDNAWYISQYTLSMEIQHIVPEQRLDENPNELYYIERTVHRKDVNTDIKWTFEIGNSVESTPTFVIVGLEARYKIDSQTHNNSTFDTMSLSNAVLK